MKIISLFIYSLTSFFYVSATEINITVTDIKKAPVPDIVVYLTPLNNKNEHPVNKESVEIYQHNKKFTPYIAVIQKGQALTFKNQDDITHHIYSVSGENRFSFKIKAGEDQKSPQLTHTEEIAMGCNIHDWMSGYVLVVDTPYYTKTNSEGTALLHPEIDGDYRVTIWHPQLDVINYKIEQEVTISSAKHKNILLPIQLPNSLLKIPAQENQDEFEFLQEY